MRCRWCVRDLYFVQNWETVEFLNLQGGGCCFAYPEDYGLSIRLPLALHNLSGLVVQQRYSTFLNLWTKLSTTMMRVMGAAASCGPARSPRRTMGKWWFCSAGSLFCYSSCQLWPHSAIVYGAEHSGKWMDFLCHSFVNEWVNSLSAMDGRDHPLKN